MTNYQKLIEAEKTRVAAELNIELGDSSASVCHDGDLLIERGDNDIFIPVEEVPRFVAWIKENF